MGRRILGTVCLLLAVIVTFWLYITAHRPTPTNFTVVQGDSTVNIQLDRQFVWQVGDCAVLQWEASNINAIWIGSTPSVGSRTMDWCLEGRQSIPHWRVYYPDDTQVAYTPFLIQTRRFVLWYTALPLIVLGVYALGWLHTLRRSLARLPAWLREPFSQGGQVSMGLVLLYAAVNSAVFVNAWVHPPLVSYDAEGHYNYALALSEGRFPTPEESYAFFSPPIPYIIPAATAALQPGNCSKATESCNFAMQKAAQYQNVAVSFIAGFFLLRVGRRLHDGLAFRAITLGLVAMLPVYYKSFAFIRGETFVLLFTLVTVDRLIWLLDHPPNRWDVLALGGAMGLLMLSRQWGALVMVGAIAWALVVILLRRDWRLLGAGMVAVLIAFLMSSWFYLGLGQQYGTVLAFNRSIDPVPKSWTTFLSFPLDVFSSPLRPALYRMFTPIFYTEIWGDYGGGFFQLYGTYDAAPAADGLVAYAGRVNVIGLFPTLMLVVGLLNGLVFIGRLFGAPRDTRTAAYALIGACSLATVLGYIWFLYRYPTPDGDTVKATYTLHLFPLLAILAAHVMIIIRERAQRVYWGTMCLLVLAAIYTLPMMFTRAG